VLVARLGMGVRLLGVGLTASSGRALLSGRTPWGSAFRLLVLAIRFSVPKDSREAH
jgi:hypothetical protein